MVSTFLTHVILELILTLLDVIAAFPDVDDLSKLPKSDLCSYCNVEQYRKMQADAYNEAYDEYAQSNYKYVAKACDLKVVDFNPTDGVFNVTNPDASSDTCVSGKTYTAKAGDSCDSIALSQGVSAATMYYINSNIFDCTKIAAGTKLCLPLSCTKIYQVQKGDTCLDIAFNSGIMSDQLLSYNSQINWNCTNLHDADPYWGSTLCASTPGGIYAGQPINNNTASADPQRVDPPSGTPVANGTTLECSHWFTYDGTLSCTQICLANNVAINLLTEINPSLSKTTCDKDLLVGNAYCVEPLAGWDQPKATGTVVPGMTATSTATGTKSATKTASATQSSTGEKVPSPLQPGIVDGCNEWHYVGNGDGCYSIAEKYHIKLADFYTWNSKVGNDCSGLWLHYYVCVGVAL
jgi:LysM repeat protein